MTRLTRSSTLNFQRNDALDVERWALTLKVFRFFVVASKIWQLSLSMKRLLSSATIVLALAFQSAIAAAHHAPPARRARRRPRAGATPPPIQAKPEELAKIKEKTEQIEALVKELKAKRAPPELVADVEVYAHAGKMLLEYPDMFGNQAAIEHAFITLDQGIERGKQLQAESAAMESRQEADPCLHLRN